MEARALAAAAGVGEGVVGEVVIASSGGVSDKFLGETDKTDCG